MVSRLLKVLAAVGLSLHLAEGLPPQGSSPAVSLSNCKASTFSAALAAANATLEKISPISQGGSFGEGAANIPYPTNPTNLPELCALIVKVPSSGVSSFRFGLFLPTTWNGRFLAVGNGGFAGGIPWVEMGPGAHYGMATVATDTGHSSSATDMRWALKKPESKTDWGWRAMSGSVSLGKKLTNAYYGSTIHHSYYNGCSSGGRQGLKQIQLAPDSFDGILVGAPAWWTSHMNPYVVQLSKYNLPASSAGHMTFTQFGIIANEVLRQCDSADGVSDQLLSAPDLCTFSFDPITCGKPGVDPSKCITAAQVRTAKSVYSNWTSPTDGSLLHPGLELGSEWNWLLLADESEAPFGLSFVRYFLYDDPSYPLSRFNETVVRDAERLNPGGVTADQYDLSAFKSRGGKIIMWHGMADGVVTPKASDLYYTRVADAMGGMYRLYDFFRYFKLPGVQHCWGTPLTELAPWMIAGAGQASSIGAGEWSVPGFKDADHDALLALVRWVEEGTAVDKIVATNWATQTDPSTPVLRQRPLCPWPRRQVWNGLGNVNRPDGWSCV